MSSRKAILIKRQTAQVARKAVERSALPRKTQSLCPECLDVIEAVLEGHDGRISASCTRACLMILNSNFLCRPVQERSDALRLQGHLAIGVHVHGKTVLGPH
jgi:hypothetical protein